MRVITLLAPFLAVFMALISISIIPFGGAIDIPAMQIAGKTFGPYHTMMELASVNMGVPDDPGGQLDGRLRHRPRRLVFQQ